LDLYPRQSACDGAGTPGADRCAGGEEARERFVLRSRHAIARRQNEEVAAHHHQPRRATESAARSAGLVPSRALFGKDGGEPCRQQAGGGIFLRTERMVAAGRYVAACRLFCGLPQWPVQERAAL